MTPQSPQATPEILSSMSRKKVIQLVAGRKSYCTVVDGVDPKQCFLKGVRNRIAGERVEYFLTTKSVSGTMWDKGGEEVSISCVEFDSNSGVDDNFNGTYSASVRITKSGRYHSKFTILDEVVDTFVYYDVRPAGIFLSKCLLKTWCIDEVNTSTTNKTIPAASSIFCDIILSDKYGNDIIMDQVRGITSECISVKVLNNSSDVLGPLIRSRESLSVAFSILKCGTYEVAVCIYVKDEDDDEEQVCSLSKHQSGTLQTLHITVVGGMAMVANIHGVVDSIQVGEKTEFSITAVDKNNNKTDPSTLGITSKLINDNYLLHCVYLGHKNDYTELWSYTPVRSGEYFLHVTTATGDQVGDSPFKIIILPSEEELESEINSVIRKEQGVRNMIEREAKLLRQSLQKEIKKTLRKQTEIEFRQQAQQRTAERAKAAAASLSRDLEIEKTKQLAKSKIKRTGGGFTVKYAWGE